MINVPKNLDEEKKGGQTPFFSSVRRTTLLSSLFFIAGFSSVNISLGLLASGIGSFLFDNKDVLRIVGGVLVIFFGGYLVGLIPLKFLERDRRVEIGKRRFGYFGALIIGMAFAAGWTPCTGPILGAILGMAAVEGGAVNAVLLLSAYSLGLGAPFFLSALLLNYFVKYYRRIAPYLIWFQRVCGILLIAIGAILLADKFNWLNGMIAQATGGWSVEPEFGEVNLLTAAAAGFFAFLSPCVLPLIPSYVSFITGLSIDDFLD